MTFELPYAHSANKLTDLLGKIPTLGVPPKADTSWLKSLGYKSSNDGRIVQVLRFVGFTDNSNNPTQLWRDYRGANRRQALAAAIKSAYSDLYKTYPYAHSVSTAELSNLLRANTGWGEDAVSRAIATFKALCGLADFVEENDPSGPESAKSITVNGGQANANTEGSAPSSRLPLPHTRGTSDITLNVNIQLTLPDTTDGAVYDALFSSMKRHLLSSEQNNES